MVTFQYIDPSSPSTHAGSFLTTCGYLVLMMTPQDDPLVRISVLLPKAALLIGPTFGSAVGDTHVSAALHTVCPRERAVGLPLVAKLGHSLCPAPPGLRGGAAGSGEVGQSTALRAPCRT